MFYVYTAEVFFFKKSLVYHILQKNCNRSLLRKVAFELQVIYVF